MLEHYTHLFKKVLNYLLISNFIQQNNTRHYSYFLQAQVEPVNPFFPPPLHRCHTPSSNWWENKLWFRENSTVNAEKTIQPKVQTMKEEEIEHREQEWGMGEI